MADHYFQPVNNHFDFNGATLEDVDDDIFLNSPGARGGAPTPSTNPFDDPHQIYAEKRRDIENRTLESTQKSLGLLYETEEVGKLTAVELAKQREQLEKTSQNLDEINSSLRFSQRHLNSLKSVFGGLKNYLAGNRDAASPRLSTSGSGGALSKEAELPPPMAPGSHLGAISKKPPMSPTERYDDHPISRLRADESAQAQDQLQQSKNPFQAALDNNLDEMCGNLSRLKGLALDLGTEIESQNDLIDRINYQAEDVDLKLGKQNKDMNKMMNKK